MKKSKIFVKCVSILLTLTFISAQVSLGQANTGLPDYKLAASLATDQDINPERSEGFENDVAGQAEPGAIGNGSALLELAQGKLPPRVTLQHAEFVITASKLREAISAAVSLSVANKSNVPVEHQERFQRAVDNLIDLQNRLEKRAYLYNAVVRSPEDYLLGFNFKEGVGLSVELIDRLSSTRLAQYIFHESVPEKGIITERDDHRAVYNEIQSAVFGEDEVVALKRDLREFIDEMATPGKRASASGVSSIVTHTLISPLTETLPGVPDISSIPRTTALAVHGSGYIGQGNKDDIDGLATLGFRRDLDSKAREGDVRLIIANGEGPKDITGTISLEEQKKIMLLKGETFGTGGESWFIEADGIDGTGNAAKYQEGKEGRTSSIVAIGREPLLVPDQLRAFALVYNDGGRNVRFDLSQVARNEEEVRQGRISLEQALVEFVQQYSHLTGIPLREITIHIMGNKTFDLPEANREPHRHQLLYNSVRPLGVNVENFGSGTVTPMLVSAIYPGHIYMMIAGSTETFMAGQAISQLPNSRIYMQLVSDNGFYDVKEAGIDSDTGVQLHERASEERTSTNMDRRFAFSSQDAHLLRQEKLPNSDKPYYSRATIRRILTGGQVWSTDNGNIPPLNLYQSLLLPTGYKFSVPEEDRIIEDKGIIENPDGTKTVFTLIIENGGAVLREETLARASSSGAEAAYRASLPISGKQILQQAIELDRPVLASNIDNGELSSLQIPAMMEAAREMDAFIIFEVGPGALKTYAKGKPQLPEYSARVALGIYERTGYTVTYAVHLDHNQIDAKKWKENKEGALKEAIERAKFALAAGFTSFATDTSTITDLEKKDVTERLGDVIATATQIMRTIYEGARELGIEVGNEGEVGDIGKEISTVEEALAYYQGLVERLSSLSRELGIDFTKEPLIDVIALNLGTSHGYDFDSEDRLKPYSELTINLERAKEVAQAFKKLGLNIGVALHGFSGTPVEMAPQFIGTGIAKVNINTDWQAISWKVLQAYYPELYEEVFHVAKAEAQKALEKEKDEKKKEKLQRLLSLDMEGSRNRIIFGKEGAPGIRNFFRNPKEGWALLERITNAISQGTERRRLVQRTAEEAREDYLRVRIATEPHPEGLTSSEMLFKLTHERSLELMRALELQGSAQGIDVDRSRLRLQGWQIEEIGRASASGEELTAELKAQISEDLPVRAKIFATILTDILAKHPDELFVLAVDSDIGIEQKAQIMPIYNAIDQIKDLKDADDNPLFPNLRVVRNSGDKLVSEIKTLTDNFSNVAIVGRQANYEQHMFDALLGQAWIATIDDTVADRFSYLPVFETATLTIMAALNADVESIKRFYDTISDQPITVEALQQMLKDKVIYLLPRITAINPNELRDLYEKVKTIYLSA